MLYHATNPQQTLSMHSPPLGYTKLKNSQKTETMESWENVFINYLYTGCNIKHSMPYNMFTLLYLFICLFIY